MPKEKRYTITLDFYIHARTDRQAMVKAALIAEEMRTKEDNQAQVLSLSETPFASMYSRTVHTGKLTMFEGKLLEA